MDIYQKVLDMLNTLGAKLSEGAKYVFTLYVRQAYIDGICNAIYAILALGITIICIYWAIRWIKDDELDVGSGLLVFSLVPSIIFIISLTMAINRLSNPEYFAIKEIIQTLPK